MSNEAILTLYNYDEFVPEKVSRWMNFGASPPLGQTAPDFPLWHLDEGETSLLAVCKENLYTIVEFGSFT